MPDDALKAALKRHSLQIDAVVERFLSDLETVVLRAQAVLQNKLYTLLKFDDKHSILRSPANQRTLRRIPLLWQQALDDSGLPSVVQRYMDAFPSQVPAFIDILHAMNSLAVTPYPIPTFSQSDYVYFNSLKLSAGADLSALVENAAAGVITRTAFALSGMRVQDVVKHLVKTTGASVGRAETIANTSISSFYRAVAGTGYDKIQSETKDPLRYKYFNPRDRVTRPFCLSLLNKNQSYTKQQIEGMDNGQGLPVWTSCGGYGCRGSFCLSI